MWSSEDEKEIRIIIGAVIALYMLFFGAIGFAAYTTANFFGLSFWKSVGAGFLAGVVIAGLLAFAERDKGPMPHPPCQQHLQPPANTVRKFGRKDPRPIGEVRKELEKERT